MKNSAEVVIIGGGIVGCAIAYNLAKKGCTDVVLLERGYLTSGSTGRCPGGIRLQMSTKICIQLMKISMEIFQQLQEETQYPYSIEFEQGGYLILGYIPEQLELLGQMAELQRSYGMPVERLTPDEAKQIVPWLSTEGLLGANFFGGDGYANPFHVTQAYAWAAQRMGVSFYTHTSAIGIQTRGSKITGVVTDKGVIKTSKVVNAAGAQAAEIGKMVGVEIPITPERLEACITEPVEPTIKPLVISFTPLFCCLQMAGGNIYMSAARSSPVSFDINPSSQFLFEVSSALTRAIPALGNLHIIRQWCGLMSMSPDEHPILGMAETVEGFYMAVAFSGHGFMLGPIVGKVMAEIILDEKPSVAIDKLDLERFKRGELIQSVSHLV